MTSTTPDDPLGGIQMSSALDALARAKRELRRALLIEPIFFEERRDQELNALIAANHVCDWIFPDLDAVTRIDLANRYLPPGQQVGDAAHLAHLLSRHVRWFKLARLMANVTKHRKLKASRVEATSSSRASGMSLAMPTGGAYPPIRFTKIVDPDDGSRYRASDVAAGLVNFWEDFFADPVGSIEREIHRSAAPGAVMAVRQRLEETVAAD